MLLTLYEPFGTIRGQDVKNLRHRVPANMSKTRVTFNTQDYVI